MLRAQGWVVLALLAALITSTTTAAETALALKRVVHFEDFQNREPMLLELGSGDLLVSGFPRYPHEPARAPSLWRSEDRGETWSRVDVGSPADGAIGNSDVDLALAPDGTIYFATMGFNRTTRKGTHISIGISRDGGDTWTWTLLTDREMVDRPWVAVAPDGTAHVIWNDDQGVHHVLSKDSGASWQTMPQVHPAGGSSHLALGPGGELAVRVTPIFASGNLFDVEAEFIAVSTDGGSTWAKHAPPGNREWRPFGSGGVPRWVEPIAWDNSGALYYLWSEGASMHLGKSDDRGGSWKSWEIATESTLAFFPYLVANASGELLATWFTADEAMGLRVGQLGMGAAKPQVLLSEALAFESWAETDGAWQRDTAGEYATVARLANGDIAVVTPLLDPRVDRMGFSFWRLAPVAE